MQGPKNSDLRLIDRVEQIRKNKHGITKFFIIFLKRLLLFCAIWNHRNNVSFRSHTCNPVSIIERAMVPSALL